MPKYEISTQRGKFLVETQQDLSEDQIKEQIKAKGGLDYLEGLAKPLAPPATSSAPKPVVDETTGLIKPSFKTPEIMTKSLTKPPTQDLSLGPTLKQLATGVTAPIRGFRGIGVGVATGDIQRAAEAIKPGFEPETTKEKVGAIAGEVVGAVPLYAAAAAIAGTGALATGATLAGLSATEQLAETGEISPTETALSGTVGLALPFIGKGIAKLGRKALETANSGLRQVANTTVNPNIALTRNMMELELSQTRKEAVRQVSKAIAPVFPSVAKEVVEESAKPIQETLLEASFKASNGDKEAQKFMLKRIQKLIKQTPGDRGALVKDLINNRFGDIQVGLLESQRFLHIMNKELTAVERKALPFLVEGKVPQVALDSLPGKKITPAMDKWAPKVREYLDESHKFLAENVDDASYLENYVPHIWDLTQQSGKTGMSANSFFSTRNPFLKKRKIPTLVEGMEQGYVPKTTDMSEILAAYDNMKVKTVANRKIIGSLKEMSDEFGNKLVQRIDKAPKDWPVINHPALARSIMGTDVLGNQALRKIPVAVHPEIEGPLKVILDNPFNNRAVRALETVKAVVKKVQLSFSLFHHVALEESLFGAVGAKKALAVNAKIFNTFRKGQLPAFENFELTKDAAKHGVVLGPMPEFFIGRLQRAFKTAENATKRIPGVGKVVKGFGTFNKIWDKGLWDYLHTGFKLHSYQDLLTKNMVKMKGSMSPTQVKRITAQQVNDLFGGQNWDALLVHPKTRQLLNLTFLAPDWNISALRQFGQAFQKGVKGEQGRKFWMRAGLYMFLFSNVINYANTKRVTGKGRFMWDNDPDNRTKIFFGKDEEGRNVYLRQGKQFREPFEFMLKPLKTLGNKLSPLIRAGFEQLSGTSIGGFPLEFKEAPTLKEELKGRAKSLAKQTVPFAFSGTNIGFAFPRSRGMTPFKLFQEARKAFEIGDKDAIRELAQVAKNNGIENTRGIINAAGRRVRSRIKKEKIKALKKRRK